MRTVLSGLAGLVLVGSVAGCSAESVAALTTAMQNAGNQQAQTYTRAFFTGANIAKMPFTARNGVAWDMGGLPDPYVVLVDAGTGNVVWRGQAINDVSPQRLPLVWAANPVVEVFMDRQYRLNVYDADPLSSQGEFIMGSNPFTPRQIVASPASPQYPDARAYRFTDNAQVDAFVMFSYSR